MLGSSLKRDDPFIYFILFLSFLFFCFALNERKRLHRHSQYEANRGTRLGKILPNTVDFYFFYQTDNIRRFHTADFVQRTVCSPRL